MFQTISELIPADRDYPDRTRTLSLMQCVLDGTFYDGLPHEFHEERNAGGDYIPLRDRRPSVRYGLSRVVVEDSVALLFSDGHFPVIDSPVGEVRDGLRAIFADTGLNAVMTDAALRGSVGSVALLLRVLSNRAFVDVLDSLYLAPLWDPAEPDCLLRVTERYKVSGAELAVRGYECLSNDQDYWFARYWDKDGEFWMHPAAVGNTGAADVDAGRSTRHGLGFVPIVWIKNLPGGKGVDGACTFRAAIETSIEIDYQLSQAGRGLKYSSDPTLLIREPAGLDGTMVRGAANALVVSEKGDAKLLEIGGTASQAVIEYVRVLRELALETLHGNRVDASRLSAPASGRALEMMNQGLVWLADNLRVSYGDRGVLPLARMILRASTRYRLQANGKTLPCMQADAALSLRWPAWYPQDSADRQRDAQTVIALVAAGQMSRETALHFMAPSYGISDVDAETSRIASEEIA